VGLKVLGSRLAPDTDGKHRKMVHSFIKDKDILKGTTVGAVKDDIILLLFVFLYSGFSPASTVVAVKGTSARVRSRFRW